MACFVDTQNSGSFNGLSPLRDSVTFTFAVIFLLIMFFSNYLFIVEKKFLSGMYDVFFYSYSEIQRNPSMSPQIILHRVSVVLAVELSVYVSC